MAKKKKGNKGNKGKPAAAATARVDEARVGELVEALGRSGGVEGLSDAEFEATAEHLVKARDAERLGRLIGLASSKKQEKASKRARYRLEQQGLEVPAPTTGGASAPSSGLATRGLPILMSPPRKEATRIYNFAFHLPRASGVTFVEAYFSMPEGLYRLKQMPSTATNYTKWANEMCEHVPGQIPDRIVVGPEMLQRKLWEIREHLVTNRFDHEEVDRDFGKNVLPKVPTPPPHPALALDLSGAKAMSMKVLRSVEQRVVPFEIRTATPHLERDWKEFGGGMSIRSDAVGGTGLELAVTKWVKEWGLDSVTELLLDAAVFYHGIGDADAALTYRSAAVDDEGEPSLENAVKFLTTWVVECFGKTKVDLSF